MPIDKNNTVNIIDSINTIVKIFSFLSNVSFFIFIFVLSK